MREMIEGIITCLAAGYLVYRYFSKRQLTLLVLAAFLLSLQLRGWPLHVSSSISYGFLAGSVAICCCYDFYKKRDRNLLLYALVFLYFALMNVIEILSPKR